MPTDIEKGERRAEAKARDATAGGHACPDGFAVSTVLTVLSALVLVCALFGVLAILENAWRKR